MRYKNQEIFVNLNKAYRAYLKKTRGQNNIKQYSTPTFKQPSQQESKNFHVKLGDVVYIPVPLESVLFYVGY